MPRLGHTKPGLQVETEVAQAQLDSVLLKIRCATKIWNGFCISEEWRGCYGALSLILKSGDNGRSENGCIGKYPSKWLILGGVQHVITFTHLALLYYTYKFSR
jgi:hypothetical protein